MARRGIFMIKDLKIYYNCVCAMLLQIFGAYLGSLFIFLVKYSDVKIQVELELSALRAICTLKEQYRRSDVYLKHKHYHLF